VTKRPAREAEQHTQRLGTIKVKPEWASQLDALAREDGTSISGVVRDALRLYFKRRKLPV
jgi:predicted transcriptional regulator